MTHRISCVVLLAFLLTGCVSATAKPSSTATTTQSYTSLAQLLGASPTIAPTATPDTLPTAPSTSLGSAAPSQDAASLPVSSNSAPQQNAVQPPPGQQSSTQQQIPTTPAPTATPAPTPAPTATPAPTPAPTATTPAPTPAPTATTPAPTPTPSDGAPSNPWGYNFQPGNKITAPPATFCNYFNCIKNFFHGNGYVMECKDAKYSKSGGKSGSCSGHSGNNRTLYSH